MYKKIFRIVILTVTVGILAGILCGCGRLRGVQKGSSSDGVHSGSESGVRWRITEDGTLFIEGEKIAGEPDPIGQQWQQYRDDFTKVVITAENIESTMTWFSDCSNITEVDMSEFDTENVTDMSYMFSDCSSLTDLDVSGLDTGNVTDMSHMFWGCKSLTDLDVSGFDTSNVTDMSYMFSACASLTDLDVSGFDTGKVTDMEGMFSDCRDLMDLDVSQFDTGMVTNMRSMFFNCESLTDLDVSGFDTGKVTDAEDMFGGCESIYWIKTFPNLQLQIALPLETMYDEADDEYQYFPVGLPEGIELTD